MKITVREAPATADERWDAFAEEADNATFYSLSVWTGAVRGLTGQSLCRVTAEDGDGSLLAGLTLLAKERAGVRMGVKPWATPYCGILYRQGMNHRRRLRVNEALARHLAAGYAYVRIETTTTFGDLLAFERNGWRVGVKNTYLLADNGRPLASRIEPAVRRQVKKARRLGIVAAEGREAGPLFDLYRRCYREQNLRLDFASEAFEELCDRLRVGGRASLWYARDRDRLLAGILVGRFRGAHFYTLAAFPRDEEPKVGPTLLLHDYFEQRVGSGEHLDLVGANAYTPGITTFKSKFNPREAPYLVLEWESPGFRWFYGPVRKTLQRLRGGVPRRRAAAGG